MYKTRTERMNQNLTTKADEQKFQQLCQLIQNGRLDQIKSHVEGNEQIKCQLQDTEVWPEIDASLFVNSVSHAFPKAIPIHALHNHGHAFPNHGRMSHASHNVVNRPLHLASYLGKYGTPVL